MVNKPKRIYCSHFLSSWGDRMWSYAVAVFLMRLDSNSLLLTAIYGLVISGSVLMFGSSVGNLIDRLQRLRAAQTSLVIQNSSVAIYAVILLVYESLNVKNNALLFFVKASAMIFGVIARLASVALSIIVQKDWIVVIADGDKDSLSVMNSVLRRIDLSTKLLAPLVCGLVITFGSFNMGCIFIAGWNIASMFLEYFILRSIYNSTPALANKNSTNNKGSSPSTKECDDADIPLSELKEEETAEIRDSKGKSLCHTMFKFLLIVPNGWGQYMSQSTVLAGIGLSFLYMTVLGVDIITNAFALSQCFSASLVGIIVGASAVTGIISTFLFAPLKARFGLVKTGLLSSLAQIVAILPCLASVFVAGSPFYLYTGYENMLSEVSSYDNETTPSLNNSMLSPNASDSDYGPFLQCDEGVEPPSSYLSMTLLMTGIVLARIGLWGFDLVTTQLFQENVPEHERGVVGGVQSSMNSLMDLLHFILVIVIPNPEQYGFLIIISVIFVVTGHFFYLLYALKSIKRSHT